MAEATAILDLLLTARYIGGPAFRTMAGDIDSLVAKSNTLTKLGGAFNLVGDAMLGVGVAATIGLGVAASKAMAFEQSLTRIQSVTGYSKGQMDSLKQTIFNLSDTYGISSTSIADGSYFVLSGMQSLGVGFQSVMNAQVLPALAAYVEASGAGKMGSIDFAQAAQDLPHILAGMHEPISSWKGDLADLMAAENNAALSQQQLVAGFTRFAPTGGFLGMNFGQTTALVAALASSSVVGARSGTELAAGLRNMMVVKSGQAEAAKLGIQPNQFFDKQGNLTNMMGLLDATQKALNKISDPTAKFSAATALFGATGGRAFLELMKPGANGAPGGLDIAKNILKSEGTPGMAYDRMLQVAQAQAAGPQAQWDIFKQRLENTAIVIGDKVLPVLLQFAQYVGELSIKFRTFIEAHPEAIALALKAIPALLLGGVGMKVAGGGLSALGGVQAGWQAEAGKVLKRNQQGQEALDRKNAAAEAATNARNRIGASQVDRRNQTMQREVERQQQARDAVESQNAAKLDRFQGEMTQWQSTVRTKNTELDQLLAGDALKKRQAYEQEVTKFNQGIVDLGGKHQKELGDMEKQYPKIFGRNLSEHPAVTAMKERQQQEMETALKKFPKEGDFMTPFQGTIPALPRKPLHPHLAELPEVGTFTPEVFTAEKFVPEEFKKELTRGQALHKGLGDFIRRGAGLGQGVVDLPGRGLEGLLKAGARKGEAGTLLEEGGKLHKEMSLPERLFGKAARDRGLLHLTNKMPNAFMQFGEEHALKAEQGVGHPVLGFLGGAAKDAGGGIAGGFGKLAGGIKGLLGGIPALLGMLPGLAGGFLAILGPVLLIAGVIAILVLTFLKFRTEAMQAVNTIGKGLTPVFQAFGAIFQTAIKAIQQAWQAAWPQIKPAMDQLFKDLPKITPILVAIGAVVGVVVAVIVAAIVGLVNGFLKALPFIIGFVDKVISLFGDIAKFLIDIVKAIFGKGGWGAVGHDLQLIVSDIWGIITNAFGAILHFIGGFIEGFLGFFQHLWDMLTRHSIIPDMINDIITWFLRLPDTVLKLIGDFIGNIITNLETAAVTVVAKALAIGGAITKGISDGISNTISNITGAISNVVGGAVDKFKNLLGIKSPSTVFMALGQHTMAGYALGIQSGMDSSLWKNFPYPGGNTPGYSGSGSLVNALQGLTDTLQNGTQQQNQPTDWTYEASCIRDRRLRNQDSRMPVTNSSLRDILDLAYRGSYQKTQ